MSSSFLPANTIAALSTPSGTEPVSTLGPRAFIRLRSGSWQEWEHTRSACCFPELRRKG